jgi:tetratricopeptide (TPR) repeat protein
VQAPFAVRLFTLPDAALCYARLLVFPAALSADYGADALPLSTSPGAGVGIALVGLAALWVSRKGLVQSRVALTASAVAALPMALHLNPFFPAGSLVAERYLYLPSAGLCLLAGLLALRLRPGWAGRSRHRWVCVAAAALVLATAAARTIDRNRDWRDDEALFRSAVDVVPRSVRARLNLAAVMLQKQAFEPALTQLRAAAVIRPDFPIVHLMMGEASRGAGRPDEAVAHFRQATRMQPLLLPAWSGLGTAWMDLGDRMKAAAAFDRALALAPGRDDLRRLLAAAGARAVGSPAAPPAALAVSLTRGS